MLDDVVELMEDRINEPGELTYVLYRYGLTIEPKFRNYAEFYGAVDLAMRELFRRCVTKYENEKIYENGDVT